MSKPVYWIVYIEGKAPQKFTLRRTMRLFVAVQKALGKKPIVKPVGF